MRLNFCFVRNFALLVSLSTFLPETVPASEAIPAVSPQVLTSEALQKSLSQLGSRRYRTYNQGVLVETLDGQKILAEHNSEEAFNPASVMKLATSYFALSRLGPERRFHTAVYGDSALNGKAKALPGDLYVISDGDPSLRTSDALTLGRSLARRGLRRVDGDLVIVGPFSLYSDKYPVRDPGDLLRRSFNRVGIRVKGKLRYAHAVEVDLSSKILFMRRESEKLEDILWLQNAHSINEIADQIGDMLGGPQALEQFLIENAKIAPDEIHVDRPSGLQFNRMTPRAAVKMLRALDTWLEANGMKMQDIMPLAGIDEGTLYGRLRDPALFGAVLGKTGTNPVKDGGVSALAGMAYTRDHGPVLYAIFNSHGSIPAYRRWQDRFLKGLIEENGGRGDAVLFRSGLMPVGVTAYWAPSEYLSSLDEEPYRPISSKKSKSSQRKYSKSHRSNPRRTGN